MKPKTNPSKTSNLHIDSFRPLISPAILVEELPISEACEMTVAKSREEVSRIIKGMDNRVILVVGPCSIHEPEAALEYANRLARLSKRFSDDLLIVMRVYFEKPRTTVGWKGLINDPKMDGSFAINQGLRIARKLLGDIVGLGLPTGCEFLDPISPQFTTDLVSWGAIGARTTESQVHRELASGLSMPIGFKNGTDGNVRVAIDGVISSRHPHQFLGVTDQGLAAIIATRGNSDCHIILRGSNSGPNYDEKSVQMACDALKKAEMTPKLMIDVSHGNSSKDFKRQAIVANELADRISKGESHIFGIMMESFLVEGRQDLKPGAKLTSGQSVTDACMNWETTEKIIETLAKASSARSK